MNPSWITLLLILVGTSAVAAPSPRVDLRQNIQEHRIAQGVVSGALTVRETRALVAQQRRVARTERIFEADGRLGPVEARHLNQMQNAASHSIYRHKHDHQRRW